MAKKKIAVIGRPFGGINKFVHESQVAEKEIADGSNIRCSIGLISKFKGYASLGLAVLTGRARLITQVNRKGSSENLLTVITKTKAYYGSALGTWVSFDGGVFSPSGWDSGDSGNLKDFSAVNAYGRLFFTTGGDTIKTWDPADPTTVAADIPALNNVTGNIAQVDTVTLAGTTGTANLSGTGKLIKLVTFNTSLTQTATDFVTSFAVAYLVEGILLTSSGGDLIFTANSAGTEFVHPVIENIADLSGTVVNTQANIVAVAQIEELDFSGSTGTADVTIGGLTKLATFDYNHLTTISNFVSDYEEDYLAVGIIVAAWPLAMKVDAQVAGVTFEASIANVSGTLNGVFTNIQVNVSAVKQVDTIPLTGTTGDATIEAAGGLTKTATFDTSLTITASNFVTAHAAAYLVEDIVLTSFLGNLIFTASTAGTAFTNPTVNVSTNLAGTVVNTTDSVFGSMEGGYNVSKPKIVRAFKNFIIIAKCCEDGVVHNNRLRWGRAGSYTLWKNEDDGTGMAGYIDFESDIVAVETLMSYLVVYTVDGSVWMMAYIGSPWVFRRDLIKRRANLAPVSPRAIINMHDYHMFMTHDNIYIFNGISFESIGGKIKNDILNFNTQDVDFDLCHAFNIPWLNEFHFITRASGATTCQDFFYNMDTKTWSKGNYLIDCFGEYNTKDNLNKPALTALPEIGTSTYANKFAVFARNDYIDGNEQETSQAFYFTDQNNFDGSDIDGWFQTGILSLGNEVIYKRMMKLTFLTTEDCEDFTFDITIKSGNTSDVSDTTETHTLAITATSRILNMDLTAKYFQIKVNTDLKAEHFVLRGILIEYTERGEL